MSATAHGQVFGESLQDSEQECFECSHNGSLAYLSVFVSLVVLVFPFQSMATIINR